MPVIGLLVVAVLKTFRVQRAQDPANHRADWVGVLDQSHGIGIGLFFLFGILAIFRVPFSMMSDFVIKGELMIYAKYSL